MKKFNNTTEVFDIDNINSNYKEHILNIYYCKQCGRTDYEKYWSIDNTTIRSQLASDEIADEDLYAWFKENDEEVGCAVSEEGYEGLFVLIDDEGLPHLCDCWNGTLNVRDYDAEICSKEDWDAFIAETIAFNKYLNEDEDTDNMNIEYIAEDVARMTSIMKKTIDSMKAVN